MSELFKRKSLKKDSIGPFKLESEIDTESCGLENPNDSTFVKRSNNVFDTIKECIVNESKDNPIGVVAKALEDNLNYREMSFLLAKTMLKETIDSAIARKKEEEKNNN
jgi:hypothetical protein